MSTCYSEQCSAIYISRQHREKIFENTDNRTRGSWVRSRNVTGVQCCPQLFNCLEASDQNTEHCCTKMYRNLLQFNGTYERERPIKNLYLSHQGLISEGLWVRIGQPRIFSEVMVVRGWSLSLKWEEMMV